MSPLDRLIPGADVRPAVARNARAATGRAIDLPPIPTGA